MTNNKKVERCPRKIVILFKEHVAIQTGACRIYKMPNYEAFEMC